MTFSEVCRAIAAEQEFAQRFDVAVSRAPEHLSDKDKPLELWLYWMEQYLADAKKALTSGFNRKLALDRLRCVLSIGFNAAMHHGLPSRSVSSDPKNFRHE